MIQRNWTHEADQYLQGKYKQVISNSDLCDTNLPPYEPALSEIESKYFTLGLENDLFCVDNEGYVQSKFLPNLEANTSNQKMIQLFWSFAGGKRRLFREGVCQLATASYLVLKCGWDISQIEMEPDTSNYGSLAYAVDIIIKSTQGNVVVCCEVKRNTKELEKLIEGFKYCCDRGNHEKDDCNYRQNHPKYAICEEINPKYFWAVSPYLEKCFELNYVDGKILLTELKTIPVKVKIDLL